MITLETLEIGGVSPAIRGARNPMNSWDMSDYDPETDHIGANDKKLLRSLAEAGTDHGKYLRMIVVWVDITAPLYWYKEMDTYRMGVEKNSCSTMHKIHSKPFAMGDFSYENLDMNGLAILQLIVGKLETYRQMFLGNRDKKPWWNIIQLLPSSYNQRRTYMISYAALRAMYHARKNHKLDEWHVFCDWIKTLPHSYLITGEEDCQ